MCVNDIVRSGAIAIVLLAGCGRSNVIDSYYPPDEPIPSSEVCDGLDNDLDGEVDEDFKGTGGAYVHDEHCGSCLSPCGTDEITLESACLDEGSGPFCAATGCADGYVVSNAFACVDWGARMCKECLEDEECGNFDGARCVEIDAEPRCTVDCVQGECPEGYVCDAEQLCAPPSGSCQCSPGDNYSMFCEMPVDEGICFGTALCEDGVLGECEGSDEICDGVDNDCNGTVDDPYVNEYGGYSEDIHHCGGCGIDCTENPLPVDELICGGPATDPVCAMLCADTLDGVDVGDMVDADLLIATGCECLVLSLDDDPGPALAPPEEVDANCDGADGVVIESFYVSPDGNDSGPGSPKNPKATVTAAVEAAFESLTTSTPRPHVFVSAGSYGELVELREGVLIHGGYSPDFLTLDPASYVTEIYAPEYDADWGGAALVGDGVGMVDETLVEGVRVTGASAPGPDLPSIAVYLRNCGETLEIRDSTIQSGDGVDGADGADGEAGETPGGSGGNGEEPRGAVEDGDHDCTSSSANTVAGGAGQSHTCESTATDGGDGGDSQCPEGVGGVQESGQDGESTLGAPGGDGGSGGYDCHGPFAYEGPCPFSICCGLADFTVPYEYEVADDGEPGSSGMDGDPGQGCSDALGSLSQGEWDPVAGSSGTKGTPGSGGGGGGAGGGALIDWYNDDCEFADGLGGGGGAGGAGGCGGTGGQPGTSGSPSLGVVVIFEGLGPFPDDVPVLEGLAIHTGPGGEGGNGGVGGDGGQGGSGGIGGELEPEEQITPTLAGSSSGGHGGHGGPGGSGGGGGGGCGGSTIGIWLDTGPEYVPGAAAAYELMNDFFLAPAGQGGSGGGGSAAGEDGDDGEAIDVHEV
jgi:hypothetical protein